MLSSLYALCEQVQDLEAKKVLLSTVIESTQKIRADGVKYYPEKHFVRFVYTNTPPGDPIREFLVNCYAIDGMSDWLKHDLATDYPPQFLFDVMTAVFENRSEPESELFSRLDDATYYCNKLDMPKST
jgi:hypothetical protein